jgi:Flp pilus assembly protein CpaB
VLPIAKNKRMRISIALGALAAFLGWIYLHQLESSFQENGEMAPVLIAKQYVSRGAPLRRNLFQQTLVPKAFAQPSAVSSFDVLESSPGHPRLRAAVPLPEGTQLLPTQTAAISLGQGLSEIIPDGQVAVSFSVDSAHGVGGHIIPGDLINILQTTKGPLEPRATTTLFQAVPVVAVGRRWNSPERDAAAAEKMQERGEEGKEPEDSVLTVVLNPLAASHLVQARESQILNIVLRPQGDDKPLENLP